MIQAGGTIRVAIADDQQLIRAGFRSLLEAEPDIEVNLVINQEAVQDWLEKDERRRERDKQKVEKWIRNKLESFDDGYEVPRDHPPPQVDWIIGTEVLNS